MQAHHITPWCVISPVKAYEIVIYSILQVRNQDSEILNLSDFIALNSNELQLNNFEIWGLLIIIQWHFVPGL